MKIDIGIIHFERVFCLEKTIISLSRFIKLLEERKLKGNIFICDDSFSPVQKEKCRDLAVKFGFTYLYTGGKKGLSENNNLLVSSSKAEILLHLQDDFIMNAECVQLLITSVELFIKNKKQIMLRAFNVEEKSDQFEFSDTPHFKKLNFHQKVGLYPTNLPMDKAELFMKKVALGCFTKEHIAFTTSSCFIHIGQNFTFNPSIIREKKLKMLRVYNLYIFISKTIKRILPKK
jgi:hypothetical protein